MNKLIYVGLAASLIGACGGRTSPVAPTIGVAPITIVPPRVGELEKSWPQQHPDGQYGHQDPAYPPIASQCPSSYRPVYNNWNWVCEDGLKNRVMPRRGGY